jgi:D-alanyl-D-alanine carboxypeptidase (penicillin-binding protein 5/6)
MKKPQRYPLMMAPVLLFVSLLFSDPTMLVGDTGPVRVADPIPASDRIEVAVDQSLGYAPTLFKAGLIYDGVDNKVVWEKNMNQRFPIASLTKMMVALVALEQADAGNLSLTDTVTISKLARSVGGSSIYLKVGQQLMLEELLGAAMVRSGNDAAYAIAEHIGGTESAFVELMNQRAKALKMDSTLFSNSTGMPVKNGSHNSSTAADMLLLARELVKYDCVLEYTCKSQDCIRNENGLYTYDNRNTLVSKYEEIDGLKTGFTNAAGYCVVNTANRCGHRVITIILGVATKEQRNNIAVNLFNNYYQSIGLGRLGEKFDVETARAD